jgi:hypothetical protein
MELFLSILPFLFTSMVIGICWRWSLLGLLCFCAAAGFTLALCLRDWSDFHFQAIVANARQGGGAWSSWLLGMLVYFMFSGLPAAVGGGLGYALRQIKVADSKH